VAEGGGRSNSGVRNSRRAQSQVVATLLLVGLTIALGGVVHVLVNGGFEQVSDFSKAHAEGELKRDNGLPYETTVSVRHVAGDGVDVAEAEVVVETPRRKGRLVDLPLDNCPTAVEMENQHTEGDKIFQSGCQWGGALVETTTDRWDSGKKILLSLSNGDVPSLGGGAHPEEEITVKVVDKSEETLVAETDVEVP